MTRHIRVVVVAWNSGDHLPKCLESIRLAEPVPDVQVDVVVVDNASTDGSTDDLSARFPDVRLVRTGANLGFAGGVNAALRELGDAEAVALVNPDAFVGAGWLSPLVTALDSDPSVGAACPKILFAEPGADGSARIQNAGNEMSPRWEPRDRGYGETDAGQFDEPEDVWGWCGGAVLLRRGYLDDVGLMDESLFLYAEDVDLSWRGLKRGWRYRFVPSSVVHHVHRASSGGRRTPLLDYLNRRNRLVVVSRHGGARARSMVWVRAGGGIVTDLARNLVLTAVPGRKPAWSPLRRRVRAAADAIAMLAGRQSSIPSWVLSGGPREP